MEGLSLSILLGSDLLAGTVIGKDPGSLLSIFFAVSFCSHDHFICMYVILYRDEDVGWVF